MNYQESDACDRSYWDRFYRKDHPDIGAASTFARCCMSLLPVSSSIFEIGCGNGRDAVFMARNGLRVLASDASTIAIDRLREQTRVLEPNQVLRLIAKPVERLEDRHAGTLDAVYMRFFLHAVEAPVASSALNWAFRNLRPGGRLFAEARSVLGSLYGKGRPAGRDAFIHDDHYRRFIRTPELEVEIVEVGFRVDEIVEADGLAVHGSDNPVVVRVFATRQLPQQSRASRE